MSLVAKGITDLLSNKIKIHAAYQSFAEAFQENGYQIFEVNSESPLAVNSSQGGSSSSNLIDMNVNINMVKPECPNGTHYKSIDLVADWQGSGDMLQQFSNVNVLRL